MVWWVLHGARTSHAGEKIVNSDNFCITICTTNSWISESPLKTTYQNISFSGYCMFVANLYQSPSSKALIKQLCSKRLITFRGFSYWKDFRVLSVSVKRQILYLYSIAVVLTVIMRILVWLKCLYFCKTLRIVWVQLIWNWFECHVCLCYSGTEIVSYWCLY